MAAFAPPARRGDFLYSSLLYADAGNGNHHPRASVAELAALLRPEAPKLYTKGKRPETAKHSKDPVGHWYSAQLIHYGLPVTKEKNAAKVRLLNALNQFQLEVPTWILKLESELKKEWEAENRKLKKGATSAKAAKAKGSGNLGNQRSITAQGLSVNVNVSLSSDVTFQNYGNRINLANNGTAQPLTAPAKRKRGDYDQAKVKPSATKTSTPVKKPRVKREPSLLRPPTRIKQEKNNITPSASSSRAKREYTSPQPRTAHVKKASPEPAPILISGAYNITCSTNHPAPIMTVYRNPSRGVWWARLSLDELDFVICMDPGPDTVGEACTLGWRMHDVQTDYRKFGKMCMGEVTFTTDQTVDGVLYGVPQLGDVEFWGERMSGPPETGDLQADWDAFKYETYRR